MANPKVRRCDALPVAAIMASTGSASTAINPDLDPSTDRNSIADCAAGITGPDNNLDIGTGALAAFDLECERRDVLNLDGDDTDPAFDGDDGDVYEDDVERNSDGPDADHVFSPASWWLTKLAIQTAWEDRHHDDIAAPSARPVDVDGPDGGSGYAEPTAWVRDFLIEHCRATDADRPSVVAWPGGAAFVSYGDDEDRYAALDGVDVETDRDLVEALQGVTSPALVLAAARVLRELRNDGVSRAAIDDLDAASAELADPAIRRAITNLRNDGIDAIDAGALRALVDGAA